MTGVSEAVLREFEPTKQASIADAAHLELNRSRTMGKRRLKHDFSPPWSKTPLEDHPEVASEALKSIGCIHHHQIQWLGVRSALIGKQGQPADISSTACDSRRVKGILIRQHWRSGLASVGST
jgi:hypothetical protein